MSTDASYLLSDSDETALCRFNPKNSCIKRTHTTQIALAAITAEFAQPTDSTSLTITKVSSFVTHIIRCTNDKSLRGKYDLNLDARNVWRTFFSQIFW